MQSRTRQTGLIGVFFIIAIILMSVTPVQAYQVWTSTCKTPEWTVESPAAIDQWDLMASQLQGLNCNFAPALGYPDYNPSDAQWEEIIAQYDKARFSAYQPWGHGSEELVTEEMAAAHFLEKINFLNSRGITCKYFMMYDKRGADGKINTWKEEEFDNCRAALNNNGLSHIKLIYNARSLNAGQKLKWPSVDMGLNEGSTEYWLTNKAERQDLLRFVTTDPIVKEKPFIFQVTTHHDFEDGEDDAFEAMRKVMRFISTDILGSTEFIRSNNTIILPMTYPMFTENFDFIPETNAEGTEYGKSMSGMLLSMIEQRDLFEGRDGAFITEEQVNSFVRDHYIQEGEDASVLSPGVVQSDAYSGYYGPGYLEFAGSNGYAEWDTISGCPPRMSTLTVYYSNGTGGDMDCDVIANGVVRGSLSFPPTGDWNTWAKQSIDLALAGMNTLRIQRSGSGGPAIDYLKVTFDLPADTSHPDLVAHYKLDEVLGAEAFDSVPEKGLSPVGQIADAVILGEPGVPKLGGTAFRFPGSGQILLQSDGTVASDVNPDGPFTLTMWANTDYTGNTSFYTTQGGNVGASGSGWIIKEQNGGFRVFFDTADAGQASGSGVPAISPDHVNKWWFIWLRYDGDSVQFGALLDNGAGTDTSGIYSSQVWDNTAVGGAMVLSPQSVQIGGNGLNALIDDVRFYDTSLSYADLSDIYSNIPGRANTPSPEDREVNVVINTDLGWKAGQVYDVTDPNYPVIMRNPDVTGYYVYMQETEMGTTEPNEQLFVGPVTVADGGTDPLTLANASLPLTLQDDKLYFWRVDQAVNGSSLTDPNTIPGMTWSFETPRSVPVILEDPHRVAAFPAETVEFNCTFSSHLSLVAIEWLKDGAVYAAGTYADNGDGTYTASLTIDVTSADEGDYRCRIINTSGENISGQAALLVKEQKAYWQFDGDFTDSLGNMDLTVPADANAPAFVGGLLPTSQPAGSAILCNPVTLDYLETALAQPLDWFAGHTVTAWVQADSVSSQARGVISTTSSEATFEIDQSDNWTYNGTPGTEDLGSTVVGERVFVAISYDGIATTCYFNGIQIGEPLEEDEGIQIIDSILIGNRIDEQAYYFDGIIDDIQVFNYPLSQEQIVDIMVAETQEGVCDVRYLKFADIAGGGANGDEPDCKVNLADFAALASDWMDCVLIPSSYCP